MGKHALPLLRVHLCQYSLVYDPVKSVQGLGHLQPGRCEPDQSDPPVLRIVNLLHKSLLYKSVHNFGHAALGDVQPLGNSFDSEVPLSIKKDQTLYFGKGQGELVRLVEFPVLAAFHDFRDQVLEPQGLVRQQLIVMNNRFIVHTINEINLWK